MVNSTLIIPSKATFPETVLRGLFNENAEEKYNEFKKIYTDGSYEPESHSTAAFFCEFTTPKMMRNYKLNPINGILACELYAIQEALKFIIQQTQPERFVIFTDSKSAILCIKQLFPRNYVCTITQIHVLLDALQSQGWVIAIDRAP